MPYSKGEFIAPDGRKEFASAMPRDPHAILNALPAIVGYWDSTLRNQMANHAYVDFFGMAPEEIRGRHLSEVLGPELYGLNRPYLEKALAGETQLFDRTIIDSSGTARYTQASYIPDIVDGTVRGLFVLATDITARHAADEAIQAAEARFRLAFTGSPVGMGLMDRSGALIQANPALCQMLGYAQEELRGLSFADLVDRALREQERDRIGRLLADGSGSVSSELQFVHRDGSRIWVILSLALAHDEADGEDLAIGHVQDISQRKQAEEELSASRGRLMEAERVAQMGSWELDIRNSHITWSEGLFRVYQLTPAEFDPSLEGANERVYPEDRAMVRRAVEMAIAHPSSFTVEYRAMRADGRVRTLLSRAEVVVDEEGIPVRIVGIVRDITEARLAQEALESTSADLGRRALELQQLAVHSEAPASMPDDVRLTPRQLEILRLIAHGLTNAAIADQLIVTEATVKWHVKQILTTTGASNRAEAVARVLGVPRAPAAP
jgi:PAS domain S-box-containing protein